jgi:hypothetical protein
MNSNLENSGQTSDCDNVMPISELVQLRVLIPREIKASSAECSSILGEATDQNCSLTQLQHKRVKETLERAEDLG